MASYYSRLSHVFRAHCNSNINNIIYFFKCFERDYQDYHDFIKTVYEYEDLIMDSDYSNRDIYNNALNDLIYGSKILNKCDELLAKKLINQIIIDKVSKLIANL